MRIRDAGGLSVIDFIDMDSPRHQREVEDKLKDAMKVDRARVQIGRISRFGLLELSRQRLRPSLGEATQIVCPRCDGHGRIRSVESLSLSALRLVEEHAMKENTGQVLVQAPPDVANFLVNEKRRQLSEIEVRQEVQVIVVADDKLETPHLHIERIRSADISEDAKPSYQRLTPVEVVPLPQLAKAEDEAEQPAVSRVVPASPAPEKTAETIVAAPIVAVSAPAPGGGFFAWLKGLFGSTPDAQSVAPAPARRDPGRRDRNKPAVAHAATRHGRMAAAANRVMAASHRRKRKNPPSRTSHNAPSARKPSRPRMVPAIQRKAIAKKRQAETCRPARSQQMLPSRKRSCRHRLPWVPQTKVKITIRNPHPLRAANAVAVVAVVAAVARAKVKARTRPS